MTRGYEPDYSDVVSGGCMIRARRVVIAEDLGLIPDEPRARAIARLRKYSKGEQGNTGWDIREAFDAVADALEVLLDK